VEQEKGMQELSLGSVSIWLDGLKAGDEQAAQQLWDRYFQRLVRLARSRLQNRTCVVDEEDVALSVLQSLFSTVRRGGYPKLMNRTELWPLLVSITLRTASNELKWQFTQKRTTQAELRGFELTELVCREPGPEMATQIADQLHHLLSSLNDPVLVQIAQLRLNGHSVVEIAERLIVRPRTVARKLARIHQEWEVCSR